MLLLAILALVSLTLAQELLAKLSYGSFQGAYSSNFNISHWRKIPYALPPIGENRFRAPQPPSTVQGIYDSNQEFNRCSQSEAIGAEDCLYLGLYARPWINGQRLRPVVVNFHGGGFVHGSGCLSFPPSEYPILNVSDKDILFVHPNYRLNVFGFLPGAEIAADPNSDLNVGLLDQQFVLQWVQKHIRAFGGDPDNVSIVGSSAGSASVIAQAIAKPQNPPLFSKALATSPFWPKTYKYDSIEAQNIYDRLANLTGCAGPGSLQCLKSIDWLILRKASLQLKNDQKWGASSFTWAPVVDGQFIQRPLSEAIAQGKVNVDIAFGTYNTHDGDTFVPPGLKKVDDTGTQQYDTGEASFDAWLRGFLPGLTEMDLFRVKSLYFFDGAIDMFSDRSTYFRAGMIYRDTVLACPAYWFTGAVSQGWLSEFAIPSARHSVDMYYWKAVSSIQKDDPLHYQGYAGAFASFLITGDPNTLKLTAPNVPGVPRRNDDEEWVVESEGFSTARLDKLEKRCNFWMQMAPKLPI